MVMKSIATRRVRLIPSQSAIMPAGNCIRAWDQRSALRRTDMPV